MPFQNRLLVGLNGQEPDTHLIRYASMVFRMNALNRLAGATAPPFRSSLGWPASTALGCAPFLAGTIPGHDREVRFVHLQRSARAQDQLGAASSLRSTLRAHIAAYFTGFSEHTAVACDVLKGHAIQRLPAFAADFDSDLLLLGDASWPRWRCARLAMEAPCSVWLVPSGSAPVLRRLLVPIDFSSRSADSLQVAIDLARSFPPAKCVALHVYRHETRFDNEDADRLRRRQLAHIFDHFVAGLDVQGVRIEPLFVACHHVGRAIAGAADQHHVDLVVMSTRARSRSARLILGSAAETAIRECRGSLLVLKSSCPPLGLLQSLRERLRSTEDLQFS